jgi:hypothetical protein
MRYFKVNITLGISSEKVLLNTIRQTLQKLLT